MGKEGVIRRVEGKREGERGWERERELLISIFVYLAHPNYAFLSFNLS